jgi:hypothetical protein
MEIFVEFTRRFLIIGNYIFFGILSIILIGGSLHVNSRMFYFALGCIALSLLIHYLINVIAFKINPTGRLK